MDASEFDVGGASAPSDKLDVLNKYLEEAISLSEVIERLEGDLKVAKSALHSLSTETIPDLMLELSLDEAKFRGWSVKVEEFVSGTLPKDDDKRAVAIRWLEENEAGGLIKTSLSLDFAKSQHNEALSIAAGLEEEGYAPTVKSDVHVQTLRAFARERLRNGQELPDLLGLYVGKTTKLKRVDK